MYSAHRSETGDELARPVASVPAGTAVSQAEWGDLEPYFDDAVVFVEWPEAAGAGLPPVRATVRLEHVDEQSRRILIEGDVTFAHAADPGLRHRD